MESPSSKSYSLRPELVGKREMEPEEIVSRHLTKHQQSASSTAAGGKRAAPFPERAVAPLVDVTAVDSTSLEKDIGAGDAFVMTSQIKRETTEERRDPPASWEPDSSKSHPVEDKAVFPFIRSEDIMPSNTEYKKKGSDHEREAAEQPESKGAPTLSNQRTRNHPPTYRHPHHLLPILTPPTGQTTSTRFPFIPSEDRHPPMSPANSFTVNTEREGKKVMSQAEMSEFIRSSIVKARQQAAAQPQGKQTPRTTLVEFLPPNLRTNFRTALRQQPIGKPQGPFPWSPILAHAAAAQSQFEDLETRSVAEWTEPSQLTEPSALMTMSEQLRHLGYHPGINEYLVVDQTELYEEVDRRTASQKAQDDSVGDKSGGSAGPVKGSAERQQGTDIPTTIEMDCSPFESRARDASKEESTQGKSDAKPQATTADAHTRVSSKQEESRPVVQNCPEKASVDLPVDLQEGDVQTTSHVPSEEELPDTIESLRHRLSPRSAAGLARPNSPRSTEQQTQKNDELSEASGTIVDEASTLSKQLPSTIDIMNDQDIDKIVLISMDKAQKTAKKEVQDLLQDSKRSKNKLVVKTSEGDKIMSQREVSDLINESMMRARESAQQEIAAIVKDSLRLARESAKEEIRVIVEESMRRARESTQREMQEFVKESFQKARWSDASISMGSCSQAYTAADMTQTSSIPPRQSPFGSQIPPYSTPGHGAYQLEHLKALSEEDQNNLQEAPLSVEADPAQESFEPTIDSAAIKHQKTVKESQEAHEPGEQEFPEAALNLQQESRMLECLPRTPKNEIEDGCAGDSLMVLKTCTSPDVFAGIEDHEVQDPKFPLPNAKLLLSSPRQPAENDAVTLSPEEEGIEIDPPSGGFHFDNMSASGKLRDIGTETNGFVQVEPDGIKNAPADPSGSKGHDVIGRRERYSRGNDASMSNDVVAKVREAGASITENLRDFDQQKQKRIENAALAILAESEKERRRKDRRRSSSVARIETYIDGPSIDNRDNRSSLKSEISRAGGRSRRHRSERREPPESARKSHISRKSDRESRHSASDRSSKKSSSRSRRSSTSSGRSKSSKSMSRGAETVVTQEFLARLTPKTREIKDMMTPRVQNLTLPIAPAGEDAKRADNAVRNGSLHRRCPSKDSVSVPDNKFCLHFLQFLVTGGAADDMSVAENSAAIAASTRPSRGSGGTFTATGDTGAAASVGAAGPNSNGLSSVLSPAAMFNKGSNWIDSLAEDMSSVLEGHDSTEFETEGETTTFDDRDDESSSSFSHTDGEVEEEENFAYSHDDNSYNAGWWSRGHKQPKHNADKRNLPRRLRRRERRDDEEDSLLDGA